MAKLLNLLLLVFAIQISLWVLVGQDIPGSALWTFLQNPAEWGGSSLISLFSDTLLLAGASLIVVGTFVYHSDFVTFSGITLTFLSFGSSIYNLWVYVNGQTLFGGSDLVAMLLVSPIVLIYIYVCLEFWRGIA